MEKLQCVVVLSTIPFYRCSEVWPSSTFSILCKEPLDISVQRGLLPSEVYVLLQDTALTYGINGSFQVCEEQLSL